MKFYHDDAYRSILALTFMCEGVPVSQLCQFNAHEQKRDGHFSTV